MFTLFYLLLGVLSNWLHHTVIISTLKRVKAVFKRCVLGVEKEERGEGEEVGRKRREGKGGSRKGEERGGNRETKLIRSLITL